MEELIPQEDNAILITRDGYVKRVSVKTFKARFFLTKNFLFFSMIFLKFCHINLEKWVFKLSVNLTNKGGESDEKNLVLFIYSDNSRSVHFTKLCRWLG